MEFFLIFLDRIIRDVNPNSWHEESLMNKALVIRQIPFFSQKILSCFTNDNEVISRFALRNDDKTAKQKANYFYQNTVVGKSRKEQRKIMLNFISTLQEPKESTSDLCIRLFNNLPNGFQRFNVNSPDDLVLVLRGLYTSNINPQLNSVIRLIATHAIMNTFEEIIELNRIMSSSKEEIYINPVSIVDSVYPDNSKIINKFLALLFGSMATGITLFIIGGIQGSYIPFETTINNHIMLPGMEGYIFKKISIFSAIVGLFLLPIGFGFYLTDKLHPLNSIEKIDISFRKSIGCFLLFFGSIGLCYFSLQAYEQKNILVQMINTKKQESAFKYIEQNYHSSSDIAFMKTQVILTINNEKILSNEDLSLLKKLSLDFIPVNDVGIMTGWDNTSISYPNIAINDLKSAIFGKINHSFYMNKSFYKFMIFFLVILMIINPIYALKMKNEFYSRIK